MMPGEKAKDFKGTMKKLLAYLGKFLPSIILVLEDSRPGNHQAV